MRTYENKGITRMNFTIPVTVFCPLGPNYYRSTLSVEMELGENIVDFHDLEDYFKVELNGKELTSEDLVIEVFNSNVANLKKLLFEMIEKIPTENNNCECANTKKFFYIKIISREVSFCFFPRIILYL